VSTPALELQGVRLERGRSTILDGIDWQVAGDERWVVLGPNGSGKTSLLRIASLYLHPSSGEVRVLGELLGRTDVRRLRARIGLTSQAFGDLIRPELRPVDVVMTGRNAALEPWWHTYDEDDVSRARHLLERFGAAHAADRPMATLSSGERQRVFLARAFSGTPGLVLLDEPMAGLDVGGREDLVTRLGAVAATDAEGPPVVLVTHHVDEIPAGFTHCLLLGDGRVRAAGPLSETLTADRLSDLFGVSLSVDHSRGRWSARARS
jgi:iron complex transport system ATP-binding protein